MSERVRRAWVRALLVLYPRAFREAHGEELEELYAARKSGGAGLTWDLMANAFGVRFDEAKDRRQNDPRWHPRSRRGALDGLRADLRGLSRGLASRPAFAVVFLATVALGIGANIAIFTVVNWVVLRPLPFPRPEEVVRVYWRPDSFNQRIVALFRERARSFSGLSTFSGWAFTLTGEGEPEEISGAVVTPDHFSVLGVSPLLGRTFAPEEEEPGRTDVCILGHGLWTSRFAGDEAVLGRRIELSGAGRTACTVVGVMPSSFAGIDPGQGWQVWVPLERAEDLASDDSWFLSVVGRLAPGVSVEQATAEVKELARLARDLYPRTSEEEVARARVETLRSVIVGPEIRGELFLLTAAAAIVLLVACGNLSTLLLGRYRERERELAVRFAVGANRGRVLRQLLTESVVLGIAGGALGTALAAAILGWFATRLPAELPRTQGLGIDGHVLLFALVLSVVAPLVFGLVPAMRASTRTRSMALRAGAASGEPARHRLHHFLVASEVASCLVLVTAAGLVLVAFLRLVRVDPGFDPGHALVAGVYAPDSAYGEPHQKRQLFRDVFERLASIPGVEHAGSIHILPMDSGNWDFPLYPEGWQIGPSETPPRANFRVVSPGYFRAMAIPLLEGRAFQDGDRHEGPGVGIVNESLARELWPDGSALGKEIRIFGPEGPAFHVIGIVGDVRQHGLSAEPRPEMYRPLDQWVLGRNQIVIRTSGEPAMLASTVRAAIWSVDDDVPIVRLAPMSEIVAQSVGTSRFVALLVTAFALLALALAAVGVYGVASSMAGARVREIGIRVALGASSRSVLLRVLAQGMLPVVPGMVLGLAGAQLVSTLLGRLVATMPAAEPLIFVLVAIFLALVAVAACYLPARRASRVDPVGVLRLD